MFGLTDPCCVVGGEVRGSGGFLGVSGW